MDLNIIKQTDPEIAKAIENELERQTNTLELIASENITSRAVMETQGSVLTNKYAEGYPNKRFYGGCENVDVAEDLAIKRVKKLFNAEFANVQAHSGSQANMSVYLSLLSHGDTIMGMDLAHGGHLTHGSPANFSGKYFNICSYGVDKDTGMIDHDVLSDIAQKQKPKLIVAGASAYPRIIDFKKFSEVAKSVNAYFMVDMAHIAGLIAAGLHPSPIPHAHVTTSTTHKTLRGPRGGLILANSEFAKKLNSSVFPGVQGGPLMHVIAAKAVAFKEALSDEFKNYQKQIVKNAACLAKSLVDQGLNLVSGGTDNHMMLVDLRNLKITGRDAQTVLELAGITINKNAVPFDTESPLVTSGIRIGTPSLTSRGMKETEMELIAELIVKILKNPSDEQIIKKARKKVDDLCKSFKLFRD